MTPRHRRIKSFIMKGGERYCLLVNSTTGLPLYYPNLFLITQVRNKSLSISAMESCLSALNVLMNFCDERHLDLQARFLKREFLQAFEMDAIRDYCQLNFAKERGNSSLVNVEPLHKNKRQQKNKTVRTIGSASTHNRLTQIANYSKWLATTLLPTNADRHVTLEIEKMHRGLKSRRPPKKDLNQMQSVGGLSKEQVAILLEVIRPGSERNPFDDHAIQIRNQSIIFLLMYLGIRGGELLNIKVADIDFSNNQVVIARRADEKKDTRVDQPLVKTLDRRLPMKATLVKIIHNYILQYRNKVPGARKNAYLFVTHKAGPTQGQALSRSGYVKMINMIANVASELSDLRGHALRHTWNDSYSEMLDAMHNPPSHEEQEKTRSYLQGWKEGSGSAATYTKRFTKAKAMEVGLQLQDGMSRTPKSLKND